MFVVVTFILKLHINFDLTFEPQLVGVNFQDLPFL